MKTKTYDDAIQERRALLKSSRIGIQREEWESHQRRGFSPPPLEKSFPEDGVLIELEKFEKADFGTVSMAEALAHRESRRKYSSKALTLEELSFLLWATQGVNSVDQNRVWTKRTVPSAGARHPFETYLIINRVDGVEPGLYRYLPLEHKLLLVIRDRPSAAKISEACWGQAFVGQSAVVFVWAAIPYRAEWRYSTIAYKGIAVDVGHICQNLYLACEAVGAGTCAILAYDQTAMDTLIGVDGEDEFTVYLAPVGKI